MTLSVYNLIGAGGTGSFLYPALLRYLESFHRNRDDEYVLQLIDGDHFQDTNFDRQLFSGRFVDENKASAVVAQFGLDERRHIAIDQYLGEANVADRLQDGDYVLIAVDNYPLRAIVERHGLQLDNLTVINGGNEKHDGSCQIWLRRNGENRTPPLSHMHPEILTPGVDRAAIDCMVAAELPGGEQTIVANLMSATTILNALRLVHEMDDLIPFHEIHFDLTTSKMRPHDLRQTEGWR